MKQSHPPRFRPRLSIGPALAAACLALALATPPAMAQAQGPDDILTATLRPGWLAPGGHHMAALHLALADDWKTYWRAPGDAGIPPVFDWSASRNVADVRVLWPTPDVFVVNGMQTIGYKHDLVLPLEVVPLDPAQPVHLAVQVDLGVCRDICMPAAVSLSADLVGPGAPDPAIHAALASMPVAGQAGSVTCQVEPIRDGLRVTARMTLPQTSGQEVVVLEPGSAEIWVSEAKVHREGPVLVAQADLVPPAGAPFPLDPADVTLTVLDDAQAIELRGCRAP